MSTIVTRASKGLPLSHGEMDTNLTNLNTDKLEASALVGLITASGTDTLTNKTINLASNTLVGTLSQFNTAVSDADLASVTGTETLTNKTINLTSNTLNGTAAQFNAAISDADFVTSGGALGTPSSGTLTNCTFPNLTVNTTGTAANLSGTPALPNGTTATTQTAGDSSTKLATTAYVDNKPTLTLMTAVATTSGTSVDATGIPSTAKRITLLLDSVSTNGTSQLLIQLGSGSIQTTGYESVGSYSGNAGQYDTETTGFVLEPPTGPAATGKRHGQVVFTHRGSNRYVGAGTVADYGYGVTANSGGAVSLSGTLDTIRITTLGAANTFDAGAIQVMYE